MKYFENITTPAGIIARYFFSRMRALDALPAETVDQITYAADEITKLRRSYERLPASIRRKVDGIRESEVMCRV